MIKIPLSYIQPNFLIHVLVCLLLSMQLTLSAAAQTPEELGLIIATEAREKERGFGDSTANLKMILRQKSGQESERELRMKTLEVEGDGNRSIVVFDRPRDVRGTALLTHVNLDDSDEQWLYLPALKRVKRISSSNIAGSFMGSEFSFEDMKSTEVNKYDYQYIRDEDCGEFQCTVVERYPKEKGSGYTRQVVWRDKDELRIWKIHYFDRKESHLKTLIFSDYKLHEDKYWYADFMSMVNHQSGKSTDLVWSEYEFGTGLDEKDFTSTGLKRVR